MRYSCNQTVLPFSSISPFFTFASFPSVDLRTLSCASYPCFLAALPRPSSSSCSSFNFFPHSFMFVSSFQALQMASCPFSFLAMTSWDLSAFPSAIARSSWNRSIFAPPICRFTTSLEPHCPQATGQESTLASTNELQLAAHLVQGSFL